MVSTDDRVSGSAAGQQLDLLSLSQTLWRYRIVIAGVTILCGAAAAAFALTATPIYRAQVTVTEVTDRGMSLGNSLTNQLGGLATLAGVNIGASSEDREARAVLQSRNLISEFIERNRLLPELLTGAEVAPTLWRGVRLFHDDVLTITEDTRQGVTNVAIDWTDAKVAAQWANGFVALANDIVRNRALADAKRNIDYLNGQIKQTDVVELRRVMFNLIETETKTLMFANGRRDYAFTVIDPAVPPEIRHSPRRTLITLLGVAFGLFLGITGSLFHDALTRQRRSGVQAG
jgi:uncharacterized protein involved in exopolysaccharide biosynthesis